MVCLKTGSVCSYLGIPRKTLDDWCRNGVVKCDRGGRGPGKHRRFTVMQVVSITYAYRFIEMGYSLDLGKQICDYLVTFSEYELKAKFKKGYTHLLPAQGDMYLRKSFEHGELYDIQVVYNDVKASIAKFIENGILDKDSVA